MADSAQLNVDVIFGSKNARELANTIGTELSKASRKWQGQVKREFGDAIVSASNYAFSSGQSGKAIRNMMKSDLLPLYTEFNKQLREGNTEAAERLQRALNARTKGFKRELDAMASAHERVMKNQNRSMAERADSVKGILGSLRGGPEGILNALRGGGGKLAERGKAFQDLGGGRGKMAAQMGDAAGAKNAAQMAQMGKAMAGIGTALATVAAAVGAVVMLVKLFADLESRVKDMNKAMMESAGAADFGFGAAEIRGGALRRELKSMREETTALNDNFMKFRVGAKEQQKILSTMNESGLTYARMNKQINEATAKGNELLKNRSDVTAIAITYARNLGVSTGETAATMGKFHFETDRSLTDIAEGFSIIQREATVAGFVSKRFYSTIIEVTSGLSFYGVRLEETTKMLKTFDSLLGQGAGTDVFKSMSQRGSGKSFQDSLGEFIVKGEGFVTDQFENTYKQRFASTQGQFKDLDLESLLSGATSKVDLRSTLMGKGITGQKATDISSLYTMKKAAEGDRTSQLMARRGAGPQFEAAMAMRVMPGLGAGESLSDALKKAQAEGNDALAIAVEGMADESNKTFEEIVAMSDAAAATIQHLDEVKNGVAELTEEDKKQGFFLNKQGEWMRGISSKDDRTGEIIIDENEKLAARIGDQFDVISSQPTEDGMVLKEQLNKDQQIAKDISSNITGLNDIMEQTVAAILNDIYDVLISVADFLFKDDPERLAELHFQEMMAKESKDAAKTLQALEKEERELVAKESAGLKLSEEEQTRRDALPDEISAAVINAERAQSTSAAAGGISGADIRKGSEEARRRAQVAGGDKTADTEEAKAAAAKLDEISNSFGPSAGMSEMPGWARNIMDYSAMVMPGSGVTSTLSRASTSMGLTGVGTKVSGEVGSALGIGQYAGMSSEQIDKLAEATQKGAEAAYKDRSWWRDIAGMGVVSQSVGTSEAQQREVAAALRNQTAEEQVIAEEAHRDTEELKNVMLLTTPVGALGGLMSLFDRTGDLIIPAGGGRPILTDPADTTYAAKPGGPIAAALGGGGGGGGKGGVSVNVYGGDQKKVYDTIMRVLKATGNA